MKSKQGIRTHTRREVNAKHIINKTHQGVFDGAAEGEHL